MPQLRNPQAEKFCRLYIKTFDPVEAAEGSGSPKNNAMREAQEFLDRPDVQNRLKELELLKAVTPVGLSEPERMFCERYSDTYDLIDAAEFAGFDYPEAKAYEVLKKDEVQEYLRHLNHEKQRLAQVSKGKVVEELAAIAFTSMADVAYWDASGVHVASSETLSPAEASAVASVKKTKDGVEIKLYDKLNALEKLAKLLNLYEENEFMPDVKNTKEKKGTADIDLSKVPVEVLEAFQSAEVKSC